MTEAVMFRGMVQNILNRWSGLKMAVEHQSGGRQSKEKALYLVDYINEVLFMNNKVELEDLEDLISDYMDNELQTILEDNSIQEVSRALLHLFDLFVNGKQGELLQEVNKLPPCEVWLDVNYQIAEAAIKSEEQGESSSEESSCSEAEEANRKETESMDCDWTEVSYRKKR